MKRLLREPLLHFLVLGALLFALYSWLNRESMLPSNKVLVDQPRVDALVRQFEQAWQRPPARAELQRLVDQWVRDEIIYREGLAAGMDRDDELVRRRVVQKMRFMAEGMAADVPDAAALQAWMRAHPARYQIAPTYSFRQAYFDPRQDRATLDRNVASALVALQRDPEADVGDATLLPKAMSNVGPGEVAGVFGRTFAEALTTLPAGRCSGPVESGIGTHIVCIDSRRPGRAATLVEARTQVERDLMEARTRQAAETFQAEVGRRYWVRMEADLERAVSPRSGITAPITEAP